MGLEARCAARFGKLRSSGKALLETNEVVFRGDFRLTVPLREISSAVARSGDLILEYPGGRAVLELGDAAEKWAKKILNPKSLLDKLGVKAGMKVAAVGIDQPDFLEQLRSRVGAIAGEPGKLVDVVFLGASKRSDLGELDELQRRIRSDGAIWVIRPKGNAQISQMDVLQAGRAAGLVDVKVASFSDTHTAEKFVIPLNRRPPANAPASAGSAKSRQRRPARKRG